MKKILNFLRPLNNVIWKHLVQSKLILFCGGGDTTIIEAPDPVDVSGSMTDYLAAITDPEMLQKQLTAEGQYGPQFDAISLARTQTMLEGIEGGKDSEAYRLQELKLEGLRKAKEAAGAGVTVNIDDQVFAQLGPVPPKEIGKFGVKNNPVRDNPEYKTYKKREEILRQSLSTSATADIDVEIAAAEAALNVIGEGKGQPGLLDMAENASLRAAEIQRQANDALRRGDIESLKELGLETTEALRAADPSSAEIADLTSQIAKASSKRAIEGIEPSAERQRLGELGQSQIDRIGELEQLLPSERSEAEKAELDNLRSIRSQQEQRAQRAQALADDPSLDPSRAGLSTLRDQALAVAQAAPQLGAGQETGSLQELAQMGMQQARAASARAGDPQVALQGLGESRDTVRASMLGGLPESIMMREQMFESDAFADQLRTQALEGTLSPERQRLQEQARALSAQAGEMSTAAGMVTPQQQGLRNRAQDLATRADEMFAQSGRVTPEQEELRRQSQALFSQADELAATAGDVTPEQQAIRDQASQIQARAQQLFAQAEAAPSAEKLRLQQEARNLQARSDQLFTQADTEAAALRERAGQVTPQQQEALNRAQSLSARADQMFAQTGQVTPEIQALRDQASQLFTSAGQISPQQQEALNRAQSLNARADQMFAQAGQVTPEIQALRNQASQLFESARQISPEQQVNLNRADALNARADEMFAQAGRITPEIQNLRDQASQLFESAGQVSPEQQQLRGQASAMQQRAQGLFAQAQAAPSAQKQQLQAAAMDMMQRGQSLFAQAATPSSARQAAGELAQLSAEQARQLSADAMGPLSAQRRRMAEQAARQQGLRTGRIGDQAQLAAELLNREESRAALREEARRAQDLAFQQASGFATDIETDAARLREQALGFETGGFDRARGVEGDIDAQRLALLEQGRLAEAQALASARGIESDIASQRLAQQQLGLQTGLALEDQLASQRLAEQTAAMDAGLTSLAQRQGMVGDIASQRLAQQQLGLQTGLSIEDQITSQRLAEQGQAMDASLASLAQQQGMLGDIASQRLAQQQLGLQTGLSIEDQLTSQRLAEQGRAADLALGALGAQRGVAGDIASREAALLQEARLTGQGLRSDALTAQAQAAAQARGVESDIDAQRLALIQEGRLAEAAALEGAMGIEGQISQQQLAQQGLALDARRAGLSAGTTLEGQIADQEMARQAAANQLALSTAQEARGIEQMLSDQQLARTGQALDARQLAMQEGRALERDVDTLTGERQQAALQAQQAAFGQTSEMRQAREASAMRLNELERARLAEERALAETARLERQAAEAQQQGLLDRARQFRDEAAQRRIEASAFAQQTMEADAAMREEAGRELGAQAQLTGSLLGEEQAFRRQQAEEAAQLRSDVQAAQDTAFTRQAQLAQFDESQRQNALTEALTGTGAAFGQQRQLGGDPANVILGRSSSAPVQGQSMLGQAPAVSQAYQPLFDPSMGVNLAMQQQQNVLSANIAQAQADATRSAAKSGMFGDIVGAAICWVAREVYGIENPRWLAFRHWLLTESPSWFRNLYIKYGERFAKFISNKPFIKNVIRKWMDTKIS